jgi:hypothetical protein
LIKRADPLNTAVGRLVLVLGLSVVTGRLAGQDSAVVAAFSANRHQLRLEQGVLAGPGGELLLRESRAAQFTLVGEEHGVREVPALVAALLRAIYPSGYRHLAIEVSPLSARRIGEIARTQEPRRAFDELFRDPLHWMPFYTMPPETELLAWAVGREGGYTVWGLDYEVWADRYWLRRLEPIVPADARPAVASARARADSGFARAARGDPSQVFSFTAPESLFTALREAVGPASESEAAEILEVLERTVDINRPFLAGRNYESNLKRSAYLKENFLRAYEAARRPTGGPPRMLLKFGAFHMERGLNGVRQHDVGWLAAALAEANGGRSFHVLAVGGPGTQHAVFDIRTLTYRPQPVEWIEAEAMLPVRAAMDSRDVVVFDLRPIRALIQDRRLREVAAQLERIVFGFDVVVVLTGSGPSVP